MGTTGLANVVNATVQQVISSANNFWDMLIKFLGVTLSVAVVVLVALAIRTLLRRSLKIRIEPYIYNVIEKVIVYGVLFLGLAAALAPLGINLTGLLVAGGIVGIVVGFASQTVLSNFLSGVFLYIERPIKIGDSVQVDAGTSEIIRGQVIDIDIISTKIRSWDGYIVRVPNDKLFKSVVMNYSKASAIRVVIDVGISYKSDIPKAKEAIMKALDKNPYVLVNPEPEVYIKEFGDSAIVLTVRFWAPSKVWYETRKLCLELIREELKKAGVEIPYPQLDLHVKEGVLVELKQSMGA